MSKASSSLVRKAGEEVVEGAVDTIDDALQGGPITLGSIVTNVVVGKTVGNAFDKVGKKKKIDVDLNIKKSEPDFYVAPNGDVMPSKDYDFSKKYDTPKKKTRKEVFRRECNTRT